MVELMIVVSGTHLRRDRALRTPNWRLTKTLAALPKVHLARRRRLLGARSSSPKNPSGEGAGNGAPLSVCPDRPEGKQVPCKNRVRKWGNVESEPWINFTNGERSAARAGWHSQRASRLRAGSALTRPACASCSPRAPPWGASPWRPSPSCTSRASRSHPC